nr:9109_t:CDS:2 [Entrophospora candida]
MSLKDEYPDLKDTQHDRTLAKKWNSERSRNQLHIHQPTFTSGGTNNVNISEDYQKTITNGKKINEFFSHDITSSQLRENDDTDHENDVPTSPSQDAPEYFDKLVDNVDLSYIGGEEEPCHHPKPGVSLGKTWDTFTIDELTLQNVLVPFVNPYQKQVPRSSKYSLYNEFADKFRDKFTNIIFLLEVHHTGGL